MAAKGYHLPDKPNIGFGDTSSFGQYGNINLNRNGQSFHVDTALSKSITKDNRKDQNYAVVKQLFKRTAATANLSDFHETKATKDYQSWKKFDKQLSSSLLNFDRIDLDEKDEAKDEKNLNNSTLSLHIAAYENSTEPVTVDSDGDEEDSKKKPKKLKLSIKKWDNAKQWLTGLPSVIENSFEISRQQEGNGKSKPVIMQFKASQKLLNPNQYPTFALTNAPATTTATSELSTIEPLTSAESSSAPATTTATSELSTIEPLTSAESSSAPAKRSLLGKRGNAAAKTTASSSSKRAKKSKSDGDRKYDSSSSAESEFDPNEDDKETSTTRSRKKAKTSQSSKKTNKEIELIKSDAHFIVIKNYLLDKGYTDGPKIESLRTKFGSWTVNMATELVEKLNRDEECVPGDCKRARIGAFKQLAKVMLVDDEEFDPNEDLRRWNFQKLPVCTTDSCWRPSHYGVTRKIHILKDGRKFTPRYDAIMNPKGIEKVTDKDAEPLATYFQRSFGPLIIAATKDEAYKMAKSFIVRTKLTSVEIIQRMESNECNMVKTKGSHDYLNHLQKRLVWYGNNSGIKFGNYDTINTCDHSHGTQLCIALRHQNMKMGIIFIDPKPTLPPEDSIFDSEKPFATQNIDVVDDAGDKDQNNEEPVTDAESSDDENVSKNVSEHQEAIFSRIRQIEEEAQVQCEKANGIEIGEDDIKKCVEFFCSQPDIPIQLKEDPVEMEKVIRHAITGGMVYHDRVYISQERRKEIWKEVDEYIGKYAKGMGFKYCKKHFKKL